MSKLKRSKKGYSFGHDGQFYSDGLALSVLSFERRCAEVDLILIQTSFLFFWRSLSFLKKNFKKNLLDQGKEGHKKDVIYII